MNQMASEIGCSRFSGIRNRVSIILNSLDKVPTAYHLTFIILLGFAIRTYVWHFSNWTGLISHGSNFFNLAESLAEWNWGKYFSDWRFYQPAYSLYLVPMFLFKLKDSIYVFWLHQFFSAGTIIFLYLSCSRVFGRGAALLGGLIYAMQLQIAYLIHWPSGDLAFHFQLSVFLFFILSCWERTTWKSLLYAILSGLLLAATRPEGLVVLFSAMAVLFYKKLSFKYRPARAMIVTALSVLICIVSVPLLIGSSEKVKTSVLSNTHVAWGLYIGSLPTPTNPADTDKVLLNMLLEDGPRLSRKDPQHRNNWYWTSQIALQRIRENPLKVSWLVLERYVAVIIPSTFRDNVSWRYLLIDLFFSLFTIIGVIASLLTKNAKRFYSAALLVVAFSIYTIVSAYQREWDVRVQLSAYVLLLGPASFGWNAMLRTILALDGPERDRN